MIGQVLNGTYELTDLVGSGGYANVYRARDLRSGADVAIKVLHPHIARDATIVARFEREIQLVRQLQGPSVARILDAGRDPASPPYMVMEFIQGQTAAQMVEQRGPLPISQAAEIVDGLLAALKQAHALGIVHRDLKPHNLMLDAAGRVRVLDFGVSRALGAGTITADGQLLGTPEYMAPEQLEGRPVDARADLYAVGAVLYQLLTGRPPYLRTTETDPWELVRRVRREPPPPIQQLRRDTPPALVEVVERAMARDPDRRYQNAYEMQQALAAATDADPPTPPPFRVGRPAATPTPSAVPGPTLSGPAPPAAPSDALASPTVQPTAQPSEPPSTPAPPAARPLPDDERPTVIRPALPRPALQRPPQSAPQPPATPSELAHQPAPLGAAPPAPGAPASGAVPAVPSDRPAFEQPTQVVRQPGADRTRVLDGSQPPPGARPEPGQGAAYGPAPGHEHAQGQGPAHRSGQGPGYPTGGAPPSPHGFGQTPVMGVGASSVAGAPATGQGPAAQGLTSQGRPRWQLAALGAAAGAVALLLLGAGVVIGRFSSLPLLGAAPTPTATVVAAAAPTATPRPSTPAPAPATPTGPAGAPAPKPAVSPPPVIAAPDPGAAPKPTAILTPAVASPPPVAGVLPAPVPAPSVTPPPAAATPGAGAAKPGAPQPQPQPPAAAPAPPATPSGSDVILADTFDRSEGGLLTQTSPRPSDYTFGYERGEYTIRKLNPTLPAAPIVFVRGEYADTVIAVDVRLVGEAGARYAFLVCRDRSTGNQTRQYRASIVPEGRRVILSHWHDGSQQVLAETRDNPAVQFGNATNRLELRCVGPKIEAIVNGRLVVSAEEGSLTSGEHGLGAGTFSGVEGTLEARFDNLEIRQP